MIKRDDNGVPTIQGSVALSLFGFGLLANLIFLPVTIWSYRNPVLRGLYDDGQPIEASFRALYASYALLLSIYVVALVFLINAFFRRRSTVPRFVEIMLGSAVALNLLLTLGEIALVRERRFATLNLAPFIFILPIAVAWAIYFGRSQRVKATFVYPLPAD
jgi:hypothetical protein